MLKGRRYYHQKSEKENQEELSFAEKFHKTQYFKFISAIYLNGQKQTYIQQKIKNEKKRTKK